MRRTLQQRAAKAPCRAFTLVEAVVCTLVVAVLFLGAVQAVGLSARIQFTAAERARGRALAWALLDEIVQQKYASTSTSPVAYDLLYGDPKGNSASGRWGFDDVNFQDETFFTRRERVAAFAEQIVACGPDITWAATMRADQGVRLPDDVWGLCKRSGLRRLLVGVESGSDEMLKRIRKDITIDQVFHTAEKMRVHGIGGHFPFIVGFPDESDESIQATLACARRLRSMSPDFLTPIFYFKPYPGSAIVSDAVARGFKLPNTLEAWSGFDYVQGDPGPWVSPEKFRLIERFKFFHELAWKRVSPAGKALQRLARYRCSRNDYRLPLEMWVSRAYRAEPRLS